MKHSLILIGIIILVFLLIVGVDSLFQKHQKVRLGEVNFNLAAFTGTATEWNEVDTAGFFEKCRDGEVSIFYRQALDISSTAGPVLSIICTK